MKNAVKTQILLESQLRFLLKGIDWPNPGGLVPNQTDVQKKASYS